MKEIKLNLNTTPRTTTLKEEMKYALENNMFYDFISRNGYRFSKDELVDIIKEYEYTRYRVEKHNIDFLEELMVNLEENFFNEDEE